MDKNIEYELLVQDIYQTLANENDTNAIKVQHNIKMVGRSGQEHQIDVYYEFLWMGEIHKVIIECKNYSNPVSIGKIRDFQGVLSDIGDVKGIFISKNGFQKGAINFAKYYNIVLKELRYPKASDWMGRIKTIIVTMHCCTHKITNREFVFDNEWIKRKYGEQRISIRLSVLNQDIIIEKANGEVIKNLYELENQLKCLNNEITTGLTQTFTFEDAFLHIPEHEPLKINAVKYSYDILISSEEVRIEGDSLAKAIMIDVFTEERRLFRKDL